MTSEGTVLSAPKRFTRPTAARSPFGDSQRDRPRHRRLVARDLGGVTTTRVCPLWNVEYRFVRDHVIRPGLTAAGSDPLRGALWPRVSLCSSASTVV
jgi:hypothetical protein